MSYAGKLMRNIQKRVEAGGIKPGSMQRIEVQHDNWCALLNGKGACNCNPNIVWKSDN